MTTALSSKSDTTHTHTGYATTSALEGKADVNHTHTGYASSTHNHDTAYAGINHTHTGYLTSDDLDGYATTTAMNSALSGKADSDHTHTGYAATSALDGKANVSHTHSEYATANHTHDGYVTNTALETALSGKANSSHTHSDYVTSSAMTTALSGKADTDHIHSNYASATHNHDEDYADINHTHTEYADATHTHSDYLTETELNTVITEKTALVNSALSTKQNKDIPIITYEGGTLEIGKVYKKYVTTALTIPLPTPSNINVVNQIMIYAYMGNADSSISFTHSQTIGYVNSELPTFQANKNYRIICEYDPVGMGWGIGVIEGGVIS